MRTDAWTAVLTVMFLSLNSFAQDKTGGGGDREATTPPDKADTATAGAEVTVDHQGSQTDTVTERLKKLEDENRAQKQRIETLEEKVQAHEDDMEMQGLEALAEEEDEDEEYNIDSLFSIYGFFDLTFLKAFTEKNNAAYLYLPPKSTFTTNNVNLYVHSQMTKSLEALLEVRFTSMPHGYAKKYEYVGKVGDTEYRPAGADCEPSENVVCVEDDSMLYERVDNTVMTSTTWEDYALGGLAIERVHLTYSPFEWLNVIAGRYITPYGIWNIDHGSPVVIPTRIPYIQTRKMVPLAQTGLQIFGRLFPTPALFLDYAVTLSNGRGPIDQLLDLDENKGLGLRLRLSYQHRKLKIAAGGYGYFGTYTDLKQTVVVKINEDQTINSDADNPLTARVSVTEAYKEYIGTADFRLELYGVTLQAEYIHRYVQYTKPGIRPVEEMFISGNIQDTVYTANFKGDGVYVLLAWQLPLSRWLGPVTLTPYFMYEYGNPQDTIPTAEITALQGGLNIKPSAYVTLKLEYTKHLQSTEAIKDIQLLSAQVAVSF